MYTLNADQIAAYDQDGYVLVPALFDNGEVDKLYQVATGDAAINNNSYDLNDQTGKKTKLSLWFTPGNDIYGLLTRSERMVHSVDKLMEGDAPVFRSQSFRQPALVAYFLLQQAIKYSLQRKNSFLHYTFRNCTR